jgi:hypothetical protein
MNTTVSRKPNVQEQTASEHSSTLPEDFNFDRWAKAVREQMTALLRSRGA